MKKTMSRLLAVALVLAMVCAMIPAAMAATTVVVSVPATLKVKTDTIATATVTEASGNTSWTSSDTSVATVSPSTNDSSKAVVSTLKAGTTKITATNNGVTSAEVTVTVKCSDKCAVANCDCDADHTSTACNCAACTAVTALTIEKPTSLALSKTDANNKTTPLNETSFAVKATRACASVGTAVALQDITNVESLSPSNVTVTKTPNKSEWVVSIPDTATPNSTEVPAYYLKVTYAGKETVLPVTVDATSALAISTQPVSANYLKGASVNALTVAVKAGTGKAPYQYQWYEASTNSNASGTAISGEEGTNYVPSTAEVGTKYYYCAVTDANNTTVKSNVATIKVETPAYTLSLTPTNTTDLEKGDTLTLTAQVKPVSGSATYTGTETVSFTKSGSSVSLSTTSKTLSNGYATTTATAVSTGTTTVTASVKIGDYTYTKDATIKVIETVSGDIEYYVDSDEIVELDEDDFQDFFEDKYSYGDLEYVKFSVGSAKNYGSSTYGYLYESDATKADKVTSSTKYYYNTLASDDLDSIEFRAGTKTSAYTVSIPFTATGDDKNGNPKSVSGTLVIYVNDSKHTTGDITYYVSSEDTVSLDEDDFQDFFEDEYTNGELDYVKFVIGDATNYGSKSYGYLYESDSAKADKVSSSAKYCYEASSTQDDLDDVVFTAGTRTSSYTVKIPFTATGKYKSTTKSVDGTLVIEVNDSTGVTITTDGADFDELKLVKALTPKNVSSSKLDTYYVQFEKVTGGTLYCYYKTALNNEEWSRRDKFYFDADDEEYELGDVFFLPKSNVKTAEITYTLYRESGKSYVEVDTGKITFKVEQAKATVTFTDIPANVNSWAGDAIEYMAKHGYITGTGSKTFSPNTNMSRGMLVTVLYRMAGEPSVSGIANPFKDVVKGAYYYNAVLWAYNKGIVTGKGAGKFAPNDNVSRQEIAAFIYRYAGKPTATGSLLGFSDYKSVSSYATDAMKWATRNEVITGIGGKLVPNAAATRAQVATMLYRYLEG